MGNFGETRVRQDRVEEQTYRKHLIHCSIYTTLSCIQKSSSKYYYYSRYHTRVYEVGWIELYARPSPLQVKPEPGFMAFVIPLHICVRPRRVPCSPSGWNSTDNTPVLRQSFGYTLYIYHWITTVRSRKFLIQRSIQGLHFHTRISRIGGQKLTICWLGFQENSADNFSEKLLKRKILLRALAVQDEEI